ncbi:unnamed protein product [Rhizophagus irregularis]|nr:unnamed protein product [Rhizophagus irregularis]
MQEVVLTLRATISPEIIIYKINEDNVSLEKYKPNSESSKVTIDVNNDLNINNSLILNTMPNLNTMSNLNAISNTTSLSINVYESSNVIYESSTSSQNYLDSSSIASDRSSVNLIESIYGAVVDKLISYIIKKHNGCITFDQVQQLIDKKMLQLNQNYRRQ